MFKSASVFILIHQIIPHLLFKIENLLFSTNYFFKILLFQQQMLYQSIGIDSNILRTIIEKDKDKKSKKKVTGILGEVRQQVQKIRDDEDRMNEAEKHFINALHYKAPRQQKQMGQQNSFLNFVYFLQTSFLWNKLLVILSYVFMYLILITHKKPQIGQIVIQTLILLLFWSNIAMEVYHKCFQRFRVKSRYQARFFIKLFVLTFLLLDHLLAIIQADHQNFIRPFLVMRCTLPAVYDINLRKNIQAMLSLYKDILVFVFFYLIVVLIFTMFANHFIGNPQKQQYDMFNQNYGYFGRAFFIMYSLSAFQSYPDNQIKVIRQHFLVYAFFIAYIFLNLFLFLTIPTSLLFEAFKEARSKIILIDEIKQQNSLIFAFCCLCEGDLQIERTKFMKFLLKCFKNKNGYLLEIATIAMQVDENQNQKIQISQFMQIFKIMHSHSSLYPPMFHDWQPWIQFRQHVNERYCIKTIVTDIKFKIFICFFIFLTIVNCLLFIFNNLPVFAIIDNVISLMFLIELIAKLVGIGPQNFFKDPWNKLDFFIILSVCILEIISIERFHPDVLMKLFRSYRVSLLPKYLFDKGKYVQFNNFSVRISRLITQMLMTIPIVIDFFPMYLILFYFYGVIGLQIYSRITPTMGPKESPYSLYDEIGNFNSFLYSQFFLVQVIVDAGWSVVAYDYSYRYPLPVWFTLFFFVFTHLNLNLILGSLIKGVTWQVYETVQQQLNNEAIRQIAQQRQQNLLKQKNRQLEQVKQQMNVNKLLKINNLISRQIFQGKIDNQIIQKMANAGRKIGSQYMKKFSRNNIQMNQLIPKLAKQMNYNYMDSIQLSFRRFSSGQDNEKDSRNQRNDIQNGESMVFRRHKHKTSLQDNQQINNQIQHLIDEANFDQNKIYNEIISYPIHILNFLRQKVKTIKQHAQEQLIKQADEQISLKIINEQQKMLTSKFNVSKHQIFKNDESKQFFTHSIRALLQMSNSPHQQRKSIIQKLVEDNIISRELGEILQNKKIERGVWLDPQWVVRKVFLDDKRQKSVQKLQIEYFSKIYGESFKQINKDIIKPLLRLQSRITYCFRNLLRYPQITQFNFFSLLTNIENQISTKLLKKGSLFKFVFQIDSYEDSWFTFQIKQKQNGKVIRAHFIKNGIWLWYKDMIEQQIYLSQDFFNWDRIQKPQQTHLLRRIVSTQSQKLIISSNQERCVKMLFQSFETLAMCLKDRQNFFIGNPNKYQYNMFSFYKDVTNTKRNVQKRFNISKIMLVILSNQGVRKYKGAPDPLKYQLSQMEDQYQLEQNETIEGVQLSQYYSQMFNNLGKLETLEQQQKGQNQGLPFSYIVNLMQQIKATLSLYESNFVMQVQNIINQSNALNSVSFRMPKVEQIVLPSEDNVKSQYMIGQTTKTIEDQQKNNIINQESFAKSESVSDSELSQS